MFNSIFNSNFDQDLAKTMGVEVTDNDTVFDELKMEWSKMKMKISEMKKRLEEEKERARRAEDALLVSWF